jgi:hypothetical protein
LYPPQLHQHIDVMADICLHLLLTRMDKSFNQVELDITAHCDNGIACDGELDAPYVDRVRFASNVGINGVDRSFHSQILKTLVHPPISVPCDCAKVLAQTPQCRDLYDQTIAAWQTRPGYAEVCSSNATISSRLVQDTLPPLLTIVIKDPPPASQHANAYHALPSIPTTLLVPLPTGGHATFHLLNVARHNKSLHFDNVLSLNQVGIAEPVRIRIDARETTRTMPCPPGSNPVPAYVGASAWYLRQ